MGQALEAIIARAISGAIFTLTRRNKRFGTGYDIIINGKEVTLQLMDGPSTTGKVIMELKASSSELGIGFVDEISTKFQNEIFKLQNT